jgi:hypothetical protein
MTTSNTARPADMNDRGSRPRSAWIAMVAACVVIGAILRVLGARGELWLDEIWTLNQIALATNPFQVLVDLSNDNNHILNSLYLYAVDSAHGSPLRLRAFSIVLGAASVAAAGAVLARGQAGAGAIAMLLTACAYPLVHYGSEARGYAALVLCALVAIACLQRLLESASTSPALPAPATTDTATGHCLGAALGFGFLGHPAMAPTGVVLGAWAAWVLWRRTGRLAVTAHRLGVIFAPVLIWVTAAAIFYGFGWVRHGYDFGRVPFGADKFIDAYGTLLALMIGLPSTMPPAIVLVLALGVVLWLAWRRRASDDAMISLYVGAIVILPALMFAARLPNTEFPRHFLFSAVIFLLFVSDLLAMLWRRGGAPRAIAAVLIVAMLTGQALALTRLYATGRGHYVDAIATMAAEGPFTYGSDHDFRNAMVIDFYAGRHMGTATLVPEAQWCEHAPTWWLSQETRWPQPERLTLGSPRCGIAYERRHVYPVWGLSGPTLTLYHRVD